MPISINRKCQTCGKPFVAWRKDKQHCSPRCRYASANQRKGEPRERIIEAAGRRCQVPGCDYNGGGRLYVHDEGGALVVLCESCNVERVRARREEGEIPPRVGRYHGGYFHVSIDDPDEFNEADLADDGGIGQLIDALSGEKDDFGKPIPHPLDEYGYDRNRLDRVRF